MAPIVPNAPVIAAATLLASPPNGPITAVTKSDVVTFETLPARAVLAEKAMEANPPDIAMSAAARLTVAVKARVITFEIFALTGETIAVKAAKC